MDISFRSCIVMILIILFIVFCLEFWGRVKIMSYNWKIFCFLKFEKLLNFVRWKNDVEDKMLGIKLNVMEKEEWIIC